MYDKIYNEMIELSLRVPRGAHERVAKKCGITPAWGIEIRKNPHDDKDNNLTLIKKLRDAYKKEHEDHIKFLTGKDMR